MNSLDAPKMLNSFYMSNDISSVTIAESDIFNELCELMERQHVLLIALEKFCYHSDDLGERLLISGITDFISRVNEELDALMNRLEFSDLHIDFMTECLAETMGQITNEHKPSETILDYEKRQRFMAYLNKLSDDLGNYNRTIIKDRKIVVRKSHEGQITSMFYADTDNGKEILDGPHIALMDGRITDIGYFRNGVAVGAWATCFRDQPTSMIRLKNDKWYHGDPLKFKELHDSYKDKYRIVVPEETSGPEWKTVVAGSLMALAVSALLSKRKEKTKKEKVEQHVEHEVQRSN